MEIKDHPLANGYVCDFRTICEVHREMYDIVIEKDVVDKKLIKLLQESFVMAKKMNKKLREYKEDYDRGWWQFDEADLQERIDKRKRGISAVES
jgi:hypothetical protein